MEPQQQDQQAYPGGAPYGQQNMGGPAYGVPQPKDQGGFAIASLVLGIVDLLAWLLPICGLPIGIAGIILGAIGAKSSKRGMAIAGIILCAIAIVLGIVNAVAGIALLSNPDFLEQFLP